mmetsp:Transcript_120450/g.257166  ORF Transcript_120450/g.257166 Transcript_120450/m.257166 type:complete len:210 (+) Transcript_120450:270-899(+)
MRVSCQEGALPAKIAVRCTSTRSKRTETKELRLPQHGLALRSCSPCPSSTWNHKFRSLPLPLATEGWDNGWWSNISSCAGVGTVAGGGTAANNGTGVSTLEVGIDVGAATSAHKGSGGSGMAWQAAWRSPLEKTTVGFSGSSRASRFCFAPSKRRSQRPPFMRALARGTVCSSMSFARAARSSVRRMESILKPCAEVNNSMILANSPGL